MMILASAFLLISTSFVSADLVMYDFSDPAQIQGWEEVTDGCLNGVDALCGGTPPPHEHEWTVGDGGLN